MELIKPKSFFMIVTVLPLLFCNLACNTFDRSQIEGKLAKELSKSDRDTLGVLPDKPVKDLNATEKEKVASIVFNHLLNNFDHQKIIKMACHVGHIELEKEKCESERAQCLEEGSKMNESEIKGVLKKDESKIKEFVKKSDAKPKTFLNAFETMNKGLKIGTQLDCGDSKDKIKKTEEAFLKDLDNTYGQNESKTILKLISELITYSSSKFY